MVSRIMRAIQLSARTIRMKLCYFNKCVQTKGSFVDVSLSSRVYGKTGGSVSLGKGVTINRNATIAAVGGIIEIGRKCSLGRNCTIVAHEKISIGENCMFGPGVTMYDHDHLFDSTGVITQGYKTGAISIGSQCWIGANAIILRGTQIGDGCVIGAGTVVRGVIPPHSIVTNNREMIVKPIQD